MVDQLAGVHVVDQVVETEAVGHCRCALHVDATYLVNEHTSGVVTFADSRCCLRQLI